MLLGREVWVLVLVVEVLQVIGGEFNRASNKAVSNLSNLNSHSHNNNPKLCSINQILKNRILLLIKW